MRSEFNRFSVVSSATNDFLESTQGRIPLAFVRNPRARRYLLRLRPDGSARVTIPRGGSLREGRSFAGRNVAWLERARLRLAHCPVGSREWSVGTQIQFRGEAVLIEAGDSDPGGHIRLGTEAIKVGNPAADLRRVIQAHLWRMAAQELPPRVFEYAAVHRLTVLRVIVRNQKSRWGSCSRRGTISLNWRLIQVPPFVQDYLILHELMHLRQMNHSARFWREVEGVCPGYRAAERWLKEHSALLA